MCRAGGPYCYDRKGMKTFGGRKEVIERAEKRLKKTPDDYSVRMKELAELKNSPLDMQRILDSPLKDLDSYQLKAAISYMAAENRLDVLRIKESMELATVLHSEQTRGNRGNHDNTPYIEHPLRNSLRLMRLGVRDNDIIVASVLHDTLEDSSTVYVKKIRGEEPQGEMDSRRALSEHIEKTYGKRTQEIVQSVTNDYIEEEKKSSLSPEEKREIYYNHVKASLDKDDKGTILVKMADFTDNASGLHHNNIPGRETKTANQARKYLPVVAIFEDKIHTVDLGLTKENKQALLDQMARTRQRLQGIIDSNR